MTNIFNSGATAASNSTADTLASIKNYLANCYEFDILDYRCPKTGKLTRRVTDEELISLWQLADYDLVKLAERLELLHKHAYCIKFDWIISDDESLDRLRIAQPQEFFCFAVRELLSYGNYWLSYRLRHNGKFTSEGEVLHSLEFCRFAELAYNFFDSDAGYAMQNSGQLAELNEKLLLLLATGSITALQQLVKQDLSYDWFISILTNGNAVASIAKLLNQLINKYKLAHGIGFHDKLTFSDVNRLAKVARQQALAESRAKTEWKAKLIAQQASYFQKTKVSRIRKSATASLADQQTEQLIAELMLANNDKADYINQLTIQRASLIFKDNSNGVAKLNQLAKQALASRAEIAKQQGLGSQPFKLARPITIKQAVNAEQGGTSGNVVVSDDE